LYAVRTSAFILSPLLASSSTVRAVFHSFTAPVIPET
jgi:hypothetical protein